MPIDTYKVSLRNAFPTSIDEVSTEVVNEANVPKDPSFDLIFYVNKSTLSDELKYKLLTYYIPFSNY